LHVEGSGGGGGGGVMIRLHAKGSFCGDGMMTRLNCTLKVVLVVVV
jgi:hypothetical protein